MAGHSHWAGIKHKKDRVDKLRSKIFSKLSREITVAAKLGDKDPEINPRLRSAIQSARSANMPKDNIQRAIDKSQISGEANYEQIRYEGFGPHQVACIIIALTDDYDGGVFNFPKQSCQVKLKRGEAITFPPNYFYPHEVSPPSNGERYTINLWVLLGQESL